jgi:hypothetical protein
MIAFAVLVTALFPVRNLVMAVSMEVTADLAEAVCLSASLTR